MIRAQVTLEMIDQSTGHPRNGMSWSPPVPPLLSLSPTVPTLRVYLVMEFLPKVLSSVVSEHTGSGVPREVFWSVMKQLLQAVRYLHKQQVWDGEGESGKRRE